jgi:phage-related minor tail protein
LAILESGTSVETGFARGFIRVQNSLQDFAGLAEQTLVGAFQAAEDALVEFATTGEFNFSKLVDSILSDVARLLARQALSGFLGALTGGAFGFEGTAGDFFFGGGKAAGGPVMNDRSYLVGERGPEMFTPSVPGQITPAPQVNVQVVNVTDPEEVSAALNTPGTQDQIVNVIRRNRQSVRSALGI